MREPQEKPLEDEKRENEERKPELNAEWPQDAQDELQDFIESQGIYIRQ